MTIHESIPTLVRRKSVTSLLKFVLIQAPLWPLLFGFTKWCIAIGENRIIRCEMTRVAWPLEAAQTTEQVTRCGARFSKCLDSLKRIRGLSHLCIGAIIGIQLLGFGGASAVAEHPRSPSHGAFAEREERAIQTQRRESQRESLLSRIFDNATQVYWFLVLIFGFCLWIYVCQVAMADTDWQPPYDKETPRESPIPNPEQLPLEGD